MPKKQRIDEGVEQAKGLAYGYGHISVLKDQSVSLADWS